jgi:hypothetical protein
MKKQSRDPQKEQRAAEVLIAFALRLKQQKITEEEIAPFISGLIKPSPKGKALARKRIAPEIVARLISGDYVPSLPPTVSVEGLQKRFGERKLANQKSGLREKPRTSATIVSSSRAYFEKLVDEGKRYVRAIRTRTIPSEEASWELTLNRRQFLNLACKTSIIGPACFTFGGPAMLEAVDDLRNLPRITTVEGLIREFNDAPSSALMAIYQLFPTPTSSDDLPGYLEDLRRRCDQMIAVGGKVGRWHRLFVLPAAAAAHSLTLFPPSEQPDVERLIVSTAQRALDRNSPFANREVLEILWQNMLASLLQSEYDWRFFEIGSDTLNEARKVCERFLGDDEGDELLIGAGTVAWQFLLTYAHALAERGDTTGLHRVREIQSAIRRNGSRGFIWFSEIEKFLVHRAGYRDMLPQASEMTIGRSRFAAQSDERRFADFLLVLRMQLTYVNHRVAEGARSDWMRDSNRALDARNISLSFLRNSGVQPKDLNIIRALSAKLPVTPHMIRFVEHLFTSYDQAFDESPFERQDALRAKWLAKIVPFYRITPENVACSVVLNNAALRDASARFLQARDQKEQLLAWWRMAAKHGAAIVDKTQAKSIDDQLLEGSMPVSDQALISAFVDTTDRLNELR